MRSLSQTVQLDFRTVKGPVSPEFQLGEPADATKAWKSQIIDARQYISGSLNLLFLSLTAKSGTWTLWAADDMPPSGIQEANFEPIGWTATAATATPGANGAAFVALPGLEVNWLQVRWVPNAESSGTIQGVLRLTGRP